jgi:hypothetical protein
MILRNHHPTRHPAVSRAMTGLTVAACAALAADVLPALAAVGHPAAGLAELYALRLATVPELPAILARRAGGNRRRALSLRRRSRGAPPRTPEGPPRRRGLPGRPPPRPPLGRTPPASSPWLVLGHAAAWCRPNTWGATRLRW